MQDEVKDLVNTGMGDEFKQTAAELRRTATDLKSATDVRSAFRTDTPRTRPHRRVRDDVADDAITPEPDNTGVPEPTTLPPTSPADADDTDDPGSAE
jgi:hypothetical protein